MAEKNIITSVSISPKHKRMIDEINEKTGGTTFSGAVQYAIFFTHQNLYKDYIMAKKEKTPRRELTPLEIEERKEQQAKAKQTLLERKKLDIAEKLGGRVIEHDDGHKTVKWYTYWSKGKDEQELPLMSLTEELISNQFQGNVEQIKKFHNLK